MTQAEALIINGFDDSPHFESIQVPDLAPDQLLVRVQAASINAFDWKAADGRFRDNFEYQFPVTIGRDYAGVVAEVGDAVTRFKPGDAVFGYFTGQKLHRGSYATYVWCSQDECLAPLPADLDVSLAACLPLCGVVALRCVEAVAPAEGDSILIVGAPGGVGSFAVQLAHRRGAHVIAVGPMDDEDYLRGLGAGDVIEPGPDLADRVRARYPDAVRGLIDLVSYQPGFLENVRVVATGARAASVHRAVDEKTLAERGIVGTNVTSAPDRNLLAQLGELAARGDLRMPVQQVYPFADAAAGLAAAKDEHSRGKRVLTMPESD